MLHKNLPSEINPKPLTFIFLRLKYFYDDIIMYILLNYLMKINFVPMLCLKGNIVLPCPI